MAPAHGFSYFLVAPLAFAACVGYRSRLNDPSATESPGPSSRKDAGADSWRSDATGDLPGIEPDAVPPRADVPADLSPRDLPVDMARRDLPPDLKRTEVAPDLARRDVLVDIARTEVTVDLALRDVQPDATPDLLPSDSYLPANCPPGNEYILLLGGDQALHTFDPDTRQLPLLAPVSCGSFNLNSMTVSPIGPAYISSLSGDLCRVDLTTLSVEPTGLDPALVNNRSYGMALLPDSTPSGQTLYIATFVASAAGDGSGTNTLRRIDLGTYALTTVGNIVRDPPLQALELTAGADRELYGFAVGSASSLLITIDPRNATPTQVITVPQGFKAASFALVAWQGSYFLFVGQSSLVLGGTSTSFVFRYDSNTGQVVPAGVLDIDIIGAGVACRR